MHETLIVGLILDFAEEFFPVPQGEFMSRAHPTEAPFSPPPLPGMSETDQMTYCWSSECMANTSNDVYHKASLQQLCNKLIFLNEDLINYVHRFNFGFC